jgi:hypothetical protein
MNTLKFKCSEASEGRLSLQHPDVATGMSADNRVQTYEITDIPDGVPTHEVVRMANGTTFPWWAGVPRYSARYDELGMGRILRATCN